MTRLERDTLHEILGSLIILSEIVDEHFKPPMESMCGALRDILDNHAMEE